MHSPLILLTNDDGIQSPYLDVMSQVLTKELQAEVLILAPEKQRSAMSHSITLHKPLRVEEVQDNCYSVSGTPADCVYVGLMKIANRRPDLVVSGPNDGYNLGADVYYSGTVGAAVEGGLRGIPSIAVSVETGHADVVPTAAALVAQLARGLLSKDAPDKTVFNVNVPRGCEGKVRYTRLGKRIYNDDVQERKDPRNRSYYWIGGGTASIAGADDSDCVAVITEGVASITPLYLEWTHRELLKTGETPLGAGNFKIY